MFNTANTLNQLINRENLSPATMSDFMTELMSGQLGAPAAAALLTGLRAKGEPRVPITPRVLTETTEKLRKIAEREKISIGKVIDAWADGRLLPVDAQ